VRSLASGLFSHALNLGKIERNPWHDVKVLGKTIEPGDTQHYTLEEIENVIAALVDHVDCQLIMALAFFAGLRHGEITALRFDDFDGGFVHVRRNFARGAICTPKTRKSVRTIPLASPIRITLGLWRLKSGGEGYLFPGRNADLPSDIRTRITNIIKPKLSEKGLPWKGIHAGRRGLATALRALTGNSTAGRDVLGHEVEETTKDHYEGALPAEALQAMKLLDTKIGNKE
jgi:integrase